MSAHHDLPEWYYSAVAGTVSGPVPASALRAMLASGQLPASTQVRHSAWTSWFTVDAAASQLGMEATPAQQRTFDPTASLVRPTTMPYPATTSVPFNPVQASTKDLTRLRIVSWCIDGIALAAASLLLNAILPATFATLLLFVLFVAYTVVLPSRGFDTLGHAVTGIRVVTDRSDEPLTQLGLATRAALVLLLALPVLIGLALSAATMLQHQRVRAWHDVASGTSVVRTARGIRRPIVPALMPD